MAGEPEDAFVLDLTPGELTYFHPDFHAAVCRGVKHVDERYGPGATERFLRRVARNVFAELAERIRARGLDAWEEHWREVFGLEGGAWSLARDGDTLTLTVTDCPAVAYLKGAGQFSTPRFCETTRVVNDELGRLTGFVCTCDYVPGEGRCVQRFRPRSAGDAAEAGA